LASGSADKSIKLWSIRLQKEVNTFLGHSEKVTSVAFSNDGLYLASSGEDKTVKLWSMSKFKQNKEQ
jgi:WD40 repeat protein